MKQSIYLKCNGSISLNGNAHKVVEIIPSNMQSLNTVFLLNKYKITILKQSVLQTCTPR